MPNQSFFPVQRPLFLDMPSSELGDTLLLGIDMIQENSALSEMIVRDQDTMALEKKKLRHLDAQWRDNQVSVKKQSSLFNEEVSEVEKMLRTKQRMSPEAVMVFLLVRAYLGDIKSASSRHFIQDSKTLEFIMLSLGYEKVPGASTILDNLNCLSTETYDTLLAESVAIAKKKT